MALLSVQGSEIDSSFSTTALVALSIPRLRSMGLNPAETAFKPSLKIAWASTVAVVVPSPATSEVWEATSFTICAPMFSKLSSNSISLATETPSLVTVGAPKLLSRTTFLPLGPSVILTASANTFIPAIIFCRALLPNLTSLAAICLSSYLICLNLNLLIRRNALVLKHSHHIILFHNHQFLAIQFDFCPTVFPKQHLVSNL